MYLVGVTTQGPLSVFCARARWGPVHVICLQWGEEGLGLTLRGDSPVLVAGVVPGGCAAVRRHPTTVLIVIYMTVASKDCSYFKGPVCNILIDL